MLTCRDCEAPYGTDGWVDVVIPNEAWNIICPEDGVLCFRCMTKRIEAHDLSNVSVLIASGPYNHDPEFWRMQGIEQSMRLAREQKRD